MKINCEIETENHLGQIFWNLKVTADAEALEELQSSPDETLAWGTINGRLETIGAADITTQILSSGLYSLLISEEWEARRTADDILDRFEKIS